MDTFHFEATTREGNIISDTIEATNERSAIDRIQDMGFFPIKVKREVDNKGVLSGFLSTIRGRVTEKDIMTFSYQLGVLLEAGFTLDRSLSILSDLTEKKKLKELLQDLMSQVRSGKSFSEALARYPAVFPVFFVNMIKAGEAGGFIEDTVTRMAVYLENSQALKEDVRSALIYPALLSFVGTAAVIILLTFVVPQFSKIFTDMGETLPLPTVILITISNVLIKSWWILLLLAFGGVAAIRKYVHTEKGRRYWDKLKFRLPLFGKLYKESAVSRFARTFGTLLSSGVPILNALQIVKGTLGSDKISEIIASVREATRKGRGIAEPLRNSEIFPHLAVHMVTVGEETGRLDEMLIKIADRFDSEVRTTVKRMLAMLEPILILIMGIVVGFIVVAMLTAIFSINELPF